MEQPAEQAAGTPVDPLSAMLARLREAWIDAQPSLDQRRGDLGRLREALLDGRAAMVDAIAADFGHRPRHESLLSEVLATLGEIDLARRNLHRWARPRPAAAGWRLWPARACIAPRPLGVVGIISPWNYPVTLALAPLASAIAAGNHAMLKPSELVPRTAAWMRGLVADVFPADRVAMATGGAEVGAAFAALPFDHLLFTGSGTVARKVAPAAAASMTPVTLELGGRSPAIVCPDAPLDRAAARIATGKWLNAGQTCIAVDHAWVDRARVDRFVALLRTEVARRYGDLGDRAGDYARIIDDRHVDRLHALLDDARVRGARVVPLVDVDPARARSERLLPPTLVIDAPDDARVHREEIFGPWLPVRGYDRIEDAIGTAAAEARVASPLAIYPFTGDASMRDAILARVPAGGATVNDALWHYGAHDLPFGGRGSSGHGRLHGRHGFDTFSHLQAVLHQWRLAPTDLLRPPYGRRMDRLLRLLLRR